MVVWTRVRGASRELILFAASSLAFGMGYSIFDSTFNNFLNEKFSLSGFERSFLEFRASFPASWLYLFQPVCGFSAAVGSARSPCSLPQWVRC